MLNYNPGIDPGIPGLKIQPGIANPILRDTIGPKN